MAEFISTIWITSRCSGTAPIATCILILSPMMSCVTEPTRTLPPSKPLIPGQRRWAPLSGGGAPISIPLPMAALPVRIVKPMTTSTSWSGISSRCAATSNSMASGFWITWMFTVIRKAMGCFPTAWGAHRYRPRGCARRVNFGIDHMPMKAGSLNRCISSRA